MTNLELAKQHQEYCDENKYMENTYIRILTPAELKQFCDWKTERAHNHAEKVRRALVAKREYDRKADEAWEKQEKRDELYFGLALIGIPLLFVVGYLIDEHIANLINEILK